MTDIGLLVLKKGRVLSEAGTCIAMPKVPFSESKNL